MTVRTAMEIDMGNGRKEYVDSKAYNIIRHEGYLQGKADGIDEYNEALKECLLSIGDIDCEDIDYVASKLKEKNDEKNIL